VISSTFCLQQLARADVLIVVATTPLNPASIYVQQMITLLEGLWETTLLPLLSSPTCHCPRTDQFPIVIAADYRCLDDITALITTALRETFSGTPPPSNAPAIPVSKMRFMYIVVHRWLL
jgi:hypothetical protein